MDDKKQKKPEIKKLEIEKLGEELEKEKKLVEEFKHKYLRVLADYQNLEKRIFNEKEEIVKNANAHLILMLLPFLDSLDKAEVFVKDQGLTLVKDQYKKTLQEVGLEELKVLGKEFDPYTAEVIDMIDGEKDNMVTEVLRKGYTFNGKILRVAQVKVSKKVSS
ncbi:nucleotide exchange factor GrpE [Candidatus Roizmanbacteria bacterium]|nr:nucleotide exchange factor GrpE [Candidatus Roizmanbacteria bacterium]